MTNTYKNKSRHELIREIEKLRARMNAEDAVPREPAPRRSFDEVALLQALPQAQGDEILLLSETGRVVFANDAIASALGYEAQAMSGLTLPDIDQKQSRARWLSLVSSWKKEPIPVTRDTVYLTAAGEQREVSAVMAPVSVEGKTYFLCVAHGEYVAPPEPEPPREDAADTQFASLLEAMQEAVLVIDSKGVVTGSNVPAHRLFGMLKRDIIGRRYTDPKLRLLDVHGNMLSVSDHPVTVALVEEEPVERVRAAIQDEDGTLIPLHVSAAPLLDASRSVTGAVAFFRLPAAESADPAEQLIPQLVSAQRDILRSIVRADSTHELERDACNALVVAGPYPLVWIGNVGARDQRILPDMWAGEAVDHLLKIRIRWDASENGQGPFGECARSMQPQRVRDTQADPAFHPWKKQAEKHGLASVAVFPLQEQNILNGVLCVYAREADRFDITEMSLLQEIAETLAAGLNGVRNRERLEQSLSDAALLVAEARVLGDAAPFAYCVFDAQPPFTTLRANPSYLALLDEPFSSHGVDGLPLSDYLHTHAQRDLADQLPLCVERAAVVEERAVMFAFCDGSKRRYRWRLQPLPEEGPVRRILYTAQPGSETVALRETGMLVAVLPAPKLRSHRSTRVALLREQGRIASCNDRARELLGIPREAQLADMPIGALLQKSGPLLGILEEAISSREAEVPFHAPGVAGGKQLTGIATIDVDAAAERMRIRLSFED